MTSKFDGSNVYIRPLLHEDAEVLYHLRLRNRAFLQPFEPFHSDSHFTLEGQREVIQKAIESWDAGNGFGFGIFTAIKDNLIGRVNLSNVSRGAWQNCTIGYFLDEAYNGRGFTTEAVQLAVNFALHHADLHRVQASVMPRNLASIRVLEKVGFHFVGLAEYYLKINGVWEDHSIYSMTREHWREALS